MRQIDLSEELSKNMESFIFMQNYSKSVYISCAPNHIFLFCFAMVCMS